MDTSSQIIEANWMSREGTFPSGTLSLPFTHANMKRERERARTRFRKTKEQIDGQHLAPGQTILTSASHSASVGGTVVARSDLDALQAMTRS
mmetsp:Transcript_25717/g.38237  ORF Transcript_25717/g.38237 Transcript_25717/m.38237 type:complete len:92 (+) Transcript_25717:149-424(+)